VFSSQEQVMIEMRDLVQDVAVDIAKSAEWRKLTKIGTLTGPAPFLLPADYDRMLVGQGMQDQTNWFWGYYPFATVSEYMLAINSQIALPRPGGWIILGGEFKFYPAPSGVATYPYISKYIVNNGTHETFNADTDTFVLSERLLTLGLIWRYRAQKGLDYTEDMATYGLALAQEQNNDKGGRVTRFGNPMAYFPGARIAYVNRAT
jgi:hypothetical protein